MSDKMLRVAGRGDDGTAKGIKTDNEGTQYVHDIDVKTELELIKQAQQAILDRLDSPIDTQLTGSKVGYSHEDKDVIFPNAKRNDQFLELDTKDVYFHDGTGWVKW